MELELAHVQGVMQFYCRALTGAPIDVLATPALINTYLGWIDETAASTDGARIFLPPHVKRYPTRQDNFAWLKVVATHQVAYLEFGSFTFTFDTPSTLFPNRRLQLETAAGPRWEAQEPQQHPSPSRATAMERLLRLFPHRRLALDIFTVLEDSRLDARITAAYPGMQEPLRRAQATALITRPRIECLPVQEALIELLVRMSLEVFTTLPVPQGYEEIALMLACILRPLRSVGATVEDTAEATLRAYSLITPIVNVRQTPDRWRAMALDGPGGFSEAAYETLRGRWSPQLHVGEAQGTTPAGSGSLTRGSLDVTRDAGASAARRG